jgi:sodium transport system permease protein
MLGGGILQWIFGEAGLALIQVGLLLMPALLFVAAGRFDPVRTLSLHRPPTQGWGPALLVMAGGVPVAWFLAWAQSHVIEVPTEMLDALSDFLQADGIGRFLWLLLLVAILPALAEEVVFRGVLLSALRTRFSGVAAVLLNGLLFGLFHVSPQTAFRFLPTAWLGVLLAWVVWETRSLWVGIVLHFLNNATILLLSVWPRSPEWVQETGAPPPLWLLPVALLVLGVGGRALSRVRVRAPTAGAPFSDS